MKIRPVIYLISFFIILIILYFTWHHYFIYTRDAYLNADIVTVRPEISGKIKSISIKDLQQVKKGQLLITIDDTSYKQKVLLAKAKLKGSEIEYQKLQTELAQKKIFLEKAQERLKLLQKECERYRSLEEVKAISEEQLDKICNQFKIGESDVNISKKVVQMLAQTVGKSLENYSIYQQAKAELNLAQVDEIHTKIRSPIDGYVSALQLKPGDYINTGQSLFSIIDTNSWWVTANIAESDLIGIKSGKLASVTIPSLGNKSFQAKIYGTGWGVNRHDNRLSGTDSPLPYLPRQVEWIQIQQRFPVRLNLINVPPGTNLRVGASAHIFMSKYYD